MKKIFMIMCVALMSVTAFAQKGSVWVGGDLRYCLDDYKNMGIDAKAQWQCLKFLRLEGNVGYLFEKDDYERLDAQVNAHLLINLGKDGLNIYPIGGFIFGHEKSTVQHSRTISGTDQSEWYYSKDTDDAFDMLLGAGFEVPISNRVKINAEYKYLYLDTSEISVGIAVRL